MSAVIREPYLWLSPTDLEIELRQLDDEGCDVSSLQKDFENLITLGDDGLWQAENQQRAGELLDAAQRLPVRLGYSFEEPSDLPSIRRLGTEPPPQSRGVVPDAALQDKLLGAWLGRCAGCLLGKPIEGRRSEELWGFLKAADQWPLSEYIRFDAGEEVASRYPAFAALKWVDGIDYMPADDDTDYTLAGFLILKRKGADFAPADVGRFWLRHIPLLRTYTAERVAYRNMATGIQPPASAVYRNPYREWIGAQIRADPFGYVCAGKPGLAAEFAWRDASISHVKNGIYGEMFMASLIAAAARCDDVSLLLETGLSQVPKTARLYADVREVMAWHSGGLSYDEAVAQIHERWDEHSWHHWTHTNANAMVCVAALLWGDGDFGKSVCRAVQPGFDTDCNGATVGSILGMMLGAPKVPARWTARLNNTLKTSLAGHESVDIERIAAETFDLWKSIPS